MLPYKGSELPNFTPKPGFQYYADYDEDEDDDFRPGALPVFGEMAPSEGLPLNGQEYLKTVRWESARVPGIVVSPINWRNWADKQTPNYRVPVPIQPPPPGATAPLQWEFLFLRQFDALVQELEELRKKSDELNLPPLSKPLPSMRDESYWQRFCFGKRKHNKEAEVEDQQQEKEREEKSKEPEEGELEEGEVPKEEDKMQTEEEHTQPSEKPAEDMGNLPWLQLLLHLDAVGVQRLLWWHAEWLHSLGHITNERAMWLFALLARTPKPIDPDTAYHLRDILRIASKQRAQLQEGDTALLPSLNILITLAAKYYGQKEPDS